MKRLLVPKNMVLNKDCLTLFPSRRAQFKPKVESKQNKARPSLQRSPLRILKNYNRATNSIKLKSTRIGSSNETQGNDTIAQWFKNCFKASRLSEDMSRKIWSEERQDSDAQIDVFKVKEKGLDIDSCLSAITSRFEKVNRYNFATHFSGFFKTPREGSQSKGKFNKLKKDIKSDCWNLRADKDNQDFKQEVFARKI